MSDLHIEGRCDARFERVGEVFRENFEARDELGACVAVSVDGEMVVDLWGGHQDVERGIEWEEETMTVVFSCTKAATALCAHLLADRGELRLEQKVTDIWPDFAQAGKGDATVAMLLDHTVGLPALRGKLEPGDAYDWDAMAARLAAEEPFWRPGNRHGYHMTTFGFLVGEIVRRVSGKSLGAFFADEFADPMGLDMFIGLPEEENDRTADVRLFKPNEKTEPTDFAKALLADRKSLQALAFFNTGTGSPNKPDFRAAELGGQGAVANARAMATLFAPLANRDGTFGDARIDAMRAPAADGLDETLLLPTRFGQGFMLRMDNRSTHPQEGHSLRIGDGAFGHVGLGGSVVFADADHKLAFAYAMNRHGGGLLLNDRGQALIDAVYECLGLEN